MKTEERVSLDRFTELGYAGPVEVLSRSDCRRFLKAVARAPKPLDWWKGRAATSRAFYEVSVHPTILDSVARILGPNVILWGADVITRRPGEAHPWHSDIESAKPSNRTVAVWIGLENTTRDSSLTLIPYSHSFGETIQEVRRHLGKKRESVTPEDVLAWARERDDRSRMTQLDVADGEALFFDGKLWHGSLNLSGSIRRALLLQYATPESEVRIPDPKQVDWPFRDLEEPKPPCVLVRGEDRAHVNRIVPAPSPPGSSGRLPQLGPQITPLGVPLDTDEATGFMSYPIFEGSAGALRFMESHASTLTHGNSPHPPHSHQEEELLLLLSGEVDLVLPEAEPGQNKRLAPGEFVYYPAYFPHALTTVSSDPANYVMFKWHRHAMLRREHLPFGRYKAFDTSNGVTTGFNFKILFEGPTAYLRRLQCHRSTLTPGAGYEPHADPYDVAIVVLEGEIETLGERVGPFGVVYFPAGVKHGMRGVGSMPAKYLVFEFEGRRPESVITARVRSSTSKIRNPEVWKGKVRYELGRAKKKLSRSGN